MSDRIDTSPERSKAPVKVRGPRDFYGGLVLIALALLGFWAASDLADQQSLSFGPASGPRLFAGLLGAVGLLIAVNGLLVDGPPVDPYAVRGPVLVVAAILLFAVMIRGFDFGPFRLPAIGLIASTFVAFIVASLGSREMRWFESLAAAAAMTAFCTLVFVYLLELPFQLWPAF